MSAKNIIAPDEGKFRELVLYIAEKCEGDPYFGATKLNKILYMIDAFAYAQLGQPVTGVEYMKQPRGPVPRRLVPMKKKMIEAGDVQEMERPAFGMPKPQKRLIAKRPADLGAFTSTEIAHIDDVIAACMGRSAQYLSDMTHEWSGWRMAREDGRTIPYAAIFLCDKLVTDFERGRGEELIGAHEWDVR